MICPAKLNAIRDSRIENCSVAAPPSQIRQSRGGRYVRKSAGECHSLRRKHSDGAEHVGRRLATTTMKMRRFHLPQQLADQSSLLAVGRPTPTTTTASMHATVSALLLPARRRRQGLVVIGVCLSVCLCVCAHCVCPQDISERVHGSPPN